MSTTRQGDDSVFLLVLNCCTSHRHSLIHTHTQVTAAYPSKLIYFGDIQQGFASDKPQGTSVSEALSSGSAGTRGHQHQAISNSASTTVATIQNAMTAQSVELLISDFLVWLDLEMGATRTENPLQQPANDKQMFDSIMKHLTYNKVYNEWTDVCSCGENRTSDVRHCMSVSACVCVYTPAYTMYACFTALGVVVVVVIAAAAAACFGECTCCVPEPM